MEMSEAKFALTLLTGPEEGRIIELEQETIILGRDVTNDIILSDAEVSRRHSRLTLSPQGYVLEDLGSTNGTYVNDERLSGPYLLIPGDKIGLSQKLVMSYDLVTVEGVETVAMDVPAEPAVEPQVEAAIEQEDVPSAMPELEAMVEEMKKPVVEEAAAAERKPGKETAPAEKKRINRWLIVGIGVSILVILCSLVFWYLDRYHDNLLYAPLYSLLRLLGLQ
jgi:hypothetical protein